MANVADTPKVLFIIYKSNLLFPICLLTLLISIQVLSIPSTAPANMKFYFPKVRWHVLAIITDRYPLKIPKQDVRVVVLFALNFATSDILLLAMILAFIVSNGYIRKCKSDDTKKVVTRWFFIVGLFFMRGIYISSYFLRMKDLLTSYLKAGSYCMAIF